MPPKTPPDSGPENVRIPALLAERLWPRAERLAPGIWIHGVSVGEAELASTFGRILKQKRPEVSITLTASTPAGVSLLRRKFPPAPENPGVRAFPLDLPFSVRRAFDALSPRLLVLMETELWPGALNEARRRKVPVEIVNARLSERSLNRLLKARILFGGPLRALSHVAARTPLDAERFLGLGLPSSRVTVCGDLKYDRVLPDSSALATDLRELAQDRPILSAGSVAPEEIPAVLDLFQRLRSRPSTSSLLLLLAPRRPESFEEAARELGRRGLGFLKRSEWRGGSASGAPGRGAPEFGARAFGAPAFGAPAFGAPAFGAPAAVLLDTIGELAASYAAASVAILGGTFAPKGGHNILEPLHYGLPVVVGPSITNIRQTVKDAEGAVYPAADFIEATSVVESLLLDAAERERAREKARDLFRRNRGAGERAATIALELLDRPA